MAQSKGGGAEMRFQSSFNKSDDEDLVREGSPGDKGQRSPVMRMTNNFNRDNFREGEEFKSGYGQFSNMAPLNKLARTASNVNPNSSLNQLTNSMTKPL
jgi:hypothetical protein